MIQPGGFCFTYRATVSSFNGSAMTTICPFARGFGFCKVMMVQSKTLTMSKYAIDCPPTSNCTTGRLYADGRFGSLIVDSTV